MTTLEEHSSTASDRDFSQSDFCDPHTFDDAWDLYAWLRDQPGLHHDDKNDLYIAARHEDVFTISRDSDMYCCRYGVRPVIAGDMSIITLDGEEHIRQRRLINQGFTPRRVREMLPHIRELANETIDTMLEKVAAQAAEAGEDVGQAKVDFVEDFAIHVPLIIICEMLGLDPTQRLSMYRWSDAMM
ncbi:MAG: cytochrome P450, partial [Actinobacteria bacterium]|nr:cytochrome P450 [Actinomycetota bacterium]